MKKILDEKRIFFFLLVLAFTVIESNLVLSLPQFGTNIGEYQLRDIRWNDEKKEYCYTYQNSVYRTIRIWSEEKKHSDFYKVVLESMEEVIINQKEKIIFVPDRGGITDFDHYKKVFDKKSNRIISKVIETKTKSTLPQNILVIIFIGVLNSGFASMIVYSEKVQEYKNIFIQSEQKERKESTLWKNRYKVVGIICIMILFCACYF